MTDVPETQYARTADGVHIAYQVLGTGPPDLVFVGTWQSHVTASWEGRWMSRPLGRLSEFSRLITFDKRGVGLSDPISLTDPPTLEERIDDVRSVMDAAESDHAAVFAANEAGHSRSHLRRQSSGSCVGPSPVQLDRPCSSRRDPPVGHTPRGLRPGTFQLWRRLGPRGL